VNATNESMEPVQIGISDRAHATLERLVATGHFAEMRDGYRFGIAYGLSQDARPNRAEGPRRNLYSTSTLDPDGSIKFAIETLYPLDGEPVYRIAERLADWGIEEVAKALEEQFLSVADLLPEPQ
jgi:hypothetical protein